MNYDEALSTARLLQLQKLEEENAKLKKKVKTLKAKVAKKNEILRILKNLFRKGSGDYIDKGPCIRFEATGYYIFLKNNNDFKTIKKWLEEKE